MDGFKNSTKTKYGAHGSACYAKGGVVKKAEGGAVNKVPEAERGVLRAQAKVLRDTAEDLKKSKEYAVKLRRYTEDAARATTSGRSPTDEWNTRVQRDLSAETSAAMGLAKAMRSPMKKALGGKVRGGLSFNSKPLIGK